VKLSEGLQLSKHLAIRPCRSRRRVRSKTTGRCEKKNFQKPSPQSSQPLPEVQESGVSKGVSKQSTSTQEIMQMVPAPRAVFFGMSSDEQEAELLMSESDRKAGVWATKEVMQISPVLRSVFLQMSSGEQEAVLEMSESDRKAGLWATKKAPNAPKAVNFLVDPALPLSPLCRIAGCCGLGHRLQRNGKQFALVRYKYNRTAGLDWGMTWVNGTMQPAFGSLFEVSDA
jgi:hypothetical protein